MRAVPLPIEINVNPLNRRLVLFGYNGHDWVLLGQD